MDLQTIPVQLVDAVLRECHVRFSVSSLSSGCELDLFRVGRKVECDGLFHIRDFALEVIHDLRFARIWGGFRERGVWVDWRDEPSRTPLAACRNRGRPSGLVGYPATSGPAPPA